MGKILSPYSFHRHNMAADHKWSNGKRPHQVCAAEVTKEKCDAAYRMDRPSTGPCEHCPPVEFIPHDASATLGNSTAGVCWKAEIGRSECEDGTGMGFAGSIMECEGNDGLEYETCAEKERTPGGSYGIQLLGDTTSILFTIHQPIT